MANKYDVYLVMIDSKGVAAFQPFTKDRLAYLESLPKAKDTMLFKIKLSREELYAIKWMLKTDKFMAAAYELTAIRVKRGDAE